MMKSLFSFAAGVIALAVASSPASAANRTFVSGTGTDTGACAITTPCRTFAYALTQTAPSGEIIVLSSGGYGAVTISQAVSIINTGYYAGVTVASGNGITINAGTNDSVVLLGISVDGGGTGSNGIVFNSGAKLTIDQCSLTNFAGGGAVGNGILIQPTSGTHTIIITNTSASNNQYSGVYYVTPSGAATAGIVIDRVSANNNAYGINLNGTGSSVMASISNSFASGNSYGFYFTGTIASLDASYANNNSYGVATISATLALGRSVLMNNTFYGVLVNNGTVNSYKDNRIAGSTNGGPVSGTIGAATLY